MKTREIIAVPADLSLKDLNVMFGPLSGKEELVILGPADHWPHLLVKLGIISHVIQADKIGAAKWIKNFDCLDIEGPDGTHFEIFAYQPWITWSKDNATAQSS